MKTDPELEEVPRHPKQDTNLVLRSNFVTPTTTKKVFYFILLWKVVISVLISMRSSVPIPDTQPATIFCACSVCLEAMAVG